MISGEATNTNFIVFGLTRPGLEPTSYHTWGKHANLYITYAISMLEDDEFIILQMNEYFIENGSDV